MSSQKIDRVLRSRINESMINEEESKKSMINESMNIDVKNVDLIADELVGMFDSPKSRLFFCRMAWRIPRNRLMQMASIAKADAKTNPAGYFNVMCRRELLK